ncbi:hypothetical protein ACFQ2M_14370 [Kitasatospora saccharophila]|uniref:hypothetical protein n=1 Tax=Kitasatospora saccharophila TaxID=407973 RepID=UPI0036371691
MPQALYHFTSVSNWENIRDNELLEPRSEQAVSDLDHRPVIWLTDTPNGQAATGVAAECAEVRIAVLPVRAVHPWQLYREEVPGRGSNLDTVGFDADAALVTPCRSRPRTGAARTASTLGNCCGPANRPSRSRAPPTAGSWTGRS